MKNIAVIGAGISGLAAAYLLSRRHRVQLFEKEERLGGHTNTVVIDGPTGALPLDTGFLVHNDRTYPNLVRLFGELGVATRDSDMSFAVSCRRTGLEYSSRGANGFFAQRQQPARAVAPLPAPGDRALQSGSAGAARVRRMRSARRWATFSSRAVSVRVSPIAICFPWRPPSGRPRSTRSDRFRRSRSSASSTTMGCSRSMSSRRGRSSPGAATPTFPSSPRSCRATFTSGRIDSFGAAKRGAVTIDLPRSAVDAVRRSRVRVPWRSGAAAPRRPERPRARRVLELHHDDQCGVAAHGRVGAAGAGSARARRGITFWPPTPMRHRW